MQIYSGSTTRMLSQNVASINKSQMCSVELGQFPNQECRVWVNEEKVQKEVAVIQSFVGDPNKAILEYCLLIDALRRRGAEKITVVIPWMGYCIQDKIFRPGEPLSARVIADIIHATRPDRLITVDLHNSTIQGFFNLPVIHLSAIPRYMEVFKNNKDIQVVVAPDVGALKETTEIAHILDKPIAVVNKLRDRSTGKVSIVGVDGEVGGKHALIMDDFISTGGTLQQTAKYLKEKGVQKISVAVTHHLFIEGVQEKLEKSEIDTLYITDTIECPEKYSDSKKLKVVSIAQEIANNL